ncbi:MAG: lytic murein transglycosylase [Acidocella sp.]|nr:lytic murein transglycosylase [Acidocella sp.]
MDRRVLLTLLPVSLALPRLARAGDFNRFLAGLQARARAAGIPQAVVQQTTGGLVPNADVLKFDHHQAEFTETWATYSSHVLSQTRIAEGHAKAATSADLLAAMTSRFGVSAGVLLGIWGIETNYGATQGDFGVIDALTTLAWDRNSRFFGNEAIDAMRIVADGDAPAARLLGSYAGAMGQPQFMPGVYLSTAISFAGTGRPDIWNSDADALASMANYLAKAGWQPGQPSSVPVLAPSSIDVAQTGREMLRNVGYWRGLGVQTLPGGAPLADDMPASLLLPDGAGGEAFLVFANFMVIRRYNASDYYALAVGGLGRILVGA